MAKRIRRTLRATLLILVPAAVAPLLWWAVMPLSAAAPQVIETESPGYICPMHPQVVSSSAGRCPICGMDLVERKAAGGAATGSSHEGHEHVHDVPVPDEHHHDHGASMRQPEVMPDVIPDVMTVAPDLQRRMGLAYLQAQVVPFHPSVEVTAIAIADARLAVKVSPKVEGWVREIGPAAVGQRVRRGDLLFTLYSPELQQRQRDYIDLLTRRDALLAARGQDMQGVGNSAPDQMLASVARERFRARSRMLEADVPLQVMEDIEKYRRVHDVVPVLAARDGIVTEIGIAAGSFVAPGSTAVAYADPAATSVELVLNPDVAARLRSGDEVELTAAGAPIRARLDAGAALLDPVSRTARLRVPLAGRAGALLAGDVVPARILGAARHAVVVPQDAILRTGRGDFVIVAAGGDHFRQAAVQLGATNGDDVELLSGVMAGERIVTNGQFLLGAEAALQSSMQRLAHAGHGN